MAHLVNSDDRSKPKVIAKSDSESHCSANQSSDQDPILPLYSAMTNVHTENLENFKINN